MKISCPSCSAKYSIADEKVVSRLAKIRCRKCGATIVIDGKVNPPSVTASAGGDAGEAQEATEATSTEYSVDFGEGDQRTMPLSDLVAAYNAGQVTGETYVWADGFADWKALSEVSEVVNALQLAAGGSKPQAAPAPAPWEGKPAVLPAPARAAARPVRGGNSDLFGRIEHAGSEEDVSTSAPEPAGGGGGGGGLGSGLGGGLGSGGSAGGSGTGARNESSVLFSLSALTSASRPSTAGSRSSNSGINLANATGASREDSGLIDLKALTAAAVRAEAPSPSGGGFAAPAMAPMAASPLGMAAPLGLGTPMSAGLGSADLAAPQKSKTGLFIAIGIVVAAVIVALAVILKPAPPPVVVAPPPAPAPVPTPTPAPTPTVLATAPPTGAASAEEAPSADKKKPQAGGVHRPTGGGAKKPAGGGATPAAPADAPAAPPKPKGNKCGCAPTDLQCNMRCSAKG